MANVESKYLGTILDQRDAEQLTGQTLDPEVFDMLPTGNLIFVVEEEQPETYGLIKMAKMYKEPVGCGYIIGAGPQAGNLVYAQAAGVAAIGQVCEYHSDLLGLHILFGAHTGTPIRTNMLEKRFDGQVLIMTSRDIQVIDLNPISLVKRVQNKISDRGLLVGTETGV